MATALKVSGKLMSAIDGIRSTQGMAYGRRDKYADGRRFAKRVVTRAEHRMGKQIVEEALGDLLNPAPAHLRPEEQARLDELANEIEYVQMDIYHEHHLRQSLMQDIQDLRQNIGYLRQRIRDSHDRTEELGRQKMELNQQLEMLWHELQTLHMIPDDAVMAL